VEVLDRLIGRQIRLPAGSIGRVLGHLMALEHRPLVEWAFGYLNLRPGGLVLDLGCGGGMALQQVLDAAPGSTVIGLDYSPTMARQAVRRLRRHVRARGGIAQADVGAPPLRRSRFDAAYSIESLYFWPDPVRVLERAREALRPGSRLVVAVDISPHGRNPERIRDSADRLKLRIYSDAELASLFREAGFEEVGTATQPERGQGWLLAYGTAP
jgi:SAM-dependent methyltransferase